MEVINDEAMMRRERKRGVKSDVKEELALPSTDRRTEGKVFNCCIVQHVGMVWNWNFREMIPEFSFLNKLFFSKY